MLNSRRQLLHSAASLAALLSFPSRLLSAQSQPSSPKYIPYPNGRDPNSPQTTNDPAPNSPDEKAIIKQNQQQIRADVEKLYALISQLKQELSVTNTSSVLSVSFVKNAKQIEKLAKQIRDLARG
ncbi:MAG: hypothetical protein WBL63_11875 [Candidatus Acidiferrum sp.]